MASTLVESLSGLMTPDLIGKAAASLGESTAGITKATHAAISSVLAGVLGKSESPGALDQLYRLIKSPTNDGSVLNNVGSLVSNVASGSTSPFSDLGSRFVNQLFGGQLGGVTGAVGQYAGIRNSSASTMLGMTAPLVLGTLGKTVRTQGLNAAGLMEMLSSQKDSILNELPSGLTSMLGMGNEESSVRDFTNAHETNRRPAWLIPAVLVIVALIAWWGLRSKARAVQSSVVIGSVQDASDGVARAAGLSALTLPDGGQIDAAANGTESELLAFIQDRSRPVDRTTWFDFDRLRFDIGSARLTPDSRPQLQNVAAILLAYPKVKVRVGGYTDDVGDPAANEKLSQERAANVRSELIDLGVAASRLSAEGHGERNPQASNATTEGRAQNRSVSLRVTAK